MKVTIATVDVAASRTSWQVYQLM